jgi:hypothetical protein
MEVEKEKEPVWNDTVGRRRRDEAATATLSFQYNIKKEGEELGGEETEKRGEKWQIRRGKKQIFTCISEHNPQAVCFVTMETPRKNAPLSENSAVWRHITEICSEAFRN